MTKDSQLSTAYPRIRITTKAANEHRGPLFSLALGSFGSYVL